MDISNTSVFRIDDDVPEIQFSDDAAARTRIGSHPYFNEEPRRIPSGRLWRNVTYRDCPYAVHPFRDCGA